MSLTARHLVVPAMDMLVAEVKSELPAALTLVRDERNTVINRGLPTPIPTTDSYYIAKKYNAYRTPALFFEAEEIDFRKNRGANFLDGTMRIFVAAIVSAQNNDDVNRIAWRYQAALSAILDNLHLTNSDNTFKIIVIVQRAQFSESYSDSTEPGNMAERWRKGVLLECDVEFYEAL